MKSFTHPVVTATFLLLLCGGPIANAGGPLGSLRGLFASRHHGGKQLLDQTGCCLCDCPVCGHQCRLKAESVEEKIKGFDVESEVICIPRVVFPWQRPKCSTGCGHCDGLGCSTCVHNGARLRRVCRLKPDSYKCPKCEYEWEAVNLCEESRRLAEEQAKAFAEAQQANSGDIDAVGEASSVLRPGSSVIADPSQIPTDDYTLPAFEAPTVTDPIGPPGMDEALKFPTPIRPSRDR